MKKYKSKPVIIEAIQYDGKNHMEILKIGGHGGPIFKVTEIQKLIIKTLEGDMDARPTDWIIKGTEGEYYPCKDSVFQRKYEAIES